MLTVGPESFAARIRTFSVHGLPRRCPLRDTPSGRPAIQQSPVRVSAGGGTMHDSTSPEKMSASTPSPTASASTANPSRRPPRKSTLTQQQKNQKRQRATQEQLVLLEVEFNKNPTPTAAVRERIAQEINMTERSVQIWFQNRWVPGLDAVARADAD